MASKCHFSILLSFLGFHSCHFCFSVISALVRQSSSSRSVCSGRIGARCLEVLMFSELGEVIQFVPAYGILVYMPV